MRAAARVTWRSASSARSTTSRLRSTPESVLLCIRHILSLRNLHWTHLPRRRTVLASTGGSNMFVIMGATGNVGSGAAYALLEAGAPVRVVVRNVEKARPLAEKGAEVFVADISDPAALR